MKSWDARVELMGWEETPIVYIDNFYQNPDKVRNLALRFPPTNNPRYVQDRYESRYEYES